MKVSLRKYLAAAHRNIRKIWDNPGLRWEDLEMPGGIKGWELLGVGNNRAVFRKGQANWVLKIPMNPQGVGDNDLEDFYYHKYKKESDKMAACKAVTLHKVVCLVMEYVDTSKRGPLKDLPKWTHFVDCQQVGYNSKGKLVAYDYATGAI